MKLLKCYIKLLTEKLTAKKSTACDRHMWVKWEDREFHHPQYWKQEQLTFL